MGRLIDADSLILKLKRTSVFECVRNSADKNVFEIINEQPTAYDKEKVVAELEEHLLVVEMEDEHIISESNVEEYFELDVVAMSDAIDIVRRGGVDERA
jgi:hypothetical protein